uniref:DUF295 domain-containing protein n=1 Tax=Soboliphyme baturini TaxID=241478 RepID=A0A183I9A3_9BILA
LFCRKKLTTEDEDVLLYGRDTFLGDNVKVEPTAFRKLQFDDILFDSSHLAGVDPDTVMPTYWVAVCRENGLLEILSLPDFRLVYMVKKFPLGFKTLFDTDPIKLALEQDKPDNSYPSVRELMLVGLGVNKGRPHLLAFVDDELLVYEAFPFFGERFHDHLCLRFKRLTHQKLFQSGGLSSSLSFQTKLQSRGERRTSLSSSEFDTPFRRLHYFDNVSSYSGIFISGPYPYWCFMTHQGIHRFHPMQLDGRVLSFAPFHNINCEHGFIYLTDRHEMRIAQLPAYFSYDATCPAHKVNLKCTAHFVVYLLDSRTYAVTTSTKVACKKMVTLIGDEKQFEPMEHEDEHFIYPTNDQFKGELYIYHFIYV